LLAIFAYAATFMRHALPENTRRCIRFLAYSATAHFLIYSLFAYKTPWLACLPWAHVCLLAGFAISIIPKRIPAIATAAAVIALTLFTQYRQARMASGRLSSDARNPFAYVPTQRNVERLEEWLERLQQTLPADSLEPALVIGRDYWPLPWYLRGLGKTGWVSEAPSDVATMPLVFAMPEAAPDLTEKLAATHTALPRGLRADVPLMMYLRNDLWELWMNSAD
jgi:predicted membrane-bound mannosyltransferase